MEVYDSGAVLQYTERHLEDRYGMLTNQPFNAADYLVTEITGAEFEHAWLNHPPTNLW